MRTDRETTVTVDAVPMAFNLSNSLTMKLPIFPGPTTAKERKTISSAACEKTGFRDGRNGLLMEAAQWRVPS